MADIARTPSQYNEIVLEKLLSSAQLGAGNVFETLANELPSAACDTIELDEPLALLPGTRISLHQIVCRAGLLASWYASIGVGAKDPVALLLPDNLDYLLHFIALNQLGAIAVFINGQLPSAVVAQFIERVGAERVITHEAREPDLRAALGAHTVAAHCVSQDKIALDSLAPLADRYRFQFDDIVLLAHTSGTTGVPKAVQFSHGGFFFGVRQQVKKMVGERVLNALPHSHASALSIMMSYLLRGAQIKIQSHKDPEQVLKGVAQFRPDMFISFPRVYTEICRLPLAEYELGSISCWLSTGDANHRQHIETLMAFGRHEYRGEWHEGSIFIDNFGSSEFGFAAFRNVHRPGSERFDRCIGKPFSWVEAAILSADGRVLPAGEVGYLGVNSPTVTPGYWNNTLLTLRNRLGRYWLTGDWAYRDEAGYFYHVDRTTDSIELDGQTYYSTQLEETILSNFSDIFDCTLVACAGADRAARLGAVCEVTEAVDEASLRARVQAFLRAQGITAPVEVRIESRVSEQGVTGKVLKRRVREQLSEAMA